MSNINHRNAEYRSQLFRHLDGIAIAPAAFELHSGGVLDHLLEVRSDTINNISSKFEANAGYLNVALRLLASQGWLQYEVDNSSGEVSISINSDSEIAFQLVTAYKGVVELMKFSGKFHHRKFEKEPYLKWKELSSLYQEGMFESSDDERTLRIQNQIQLHIEGVLVGPTTVLLGMGGMFHKYFMETSFSPAEYHADPESFGIILDFLSSLGWFEKRGETYRFTDKGLFFAKRSSAYGVTVSYIPTFRHLDELIFRNADFLKVGPGEPEKGVDREMNVWGSGGAHVAYFKKVDEIVIDLFNKPIHEQPKGILDMGCGNGAFLIHLFDLIYQHTERGKMLEEHPLFLVGVDYNEAALKATRGNLISADVWAKVIWGDIGDPNLLAKDLKENYEIELSDLLNVRTFLDHNRIWEDVPLDNNYKSVSTGAFASSGRLLTNNEVEANLSAHLKKWQHFISKHGLILIELHGLDPNVTAKNLGKTPCTAYEATHGFSDQYILERTSFDQVISGLGIKNDSNFRSLFPNDELTTVSINYLK